MSPQRWQQVQQVFLQAVEFGEVDARASFLTQTCYEDLELRLEVEALLSADTGADAYIDSSVQAAAASVFSEDLVGERLGAYRLIREIGRGGMGSVYLGVRADAEFQKQVAIKVIRPGMDTADLLDRFRHERQILAGLEHPNIARLLDGGSTPDGRPYLVMEYVPGRRIDEYCRFHNLSLSDRLELFCQVCEPVAHAHRNLVVHRDLKPANIMVAEDGSPKLLDFGIARLLNGPAPGACETVTMVGPRITVEYSSPEQLRGLSVTTATDVYSLGAVLYELLCGERAHSLITYSAEEIQRVVCEQEPERPSAVAMRGKLAWARQLRGDLDNIALMALRKESERRYSSVEQLAADVRRYRTGLPVLAREDTVLYRGRKFLLRHRLGVIAAALAGMSLLGGAAIALREASRAETQREAAELHRRSAERERARAERESETARREHLQADRERLRAESNLLEAEDQRGRAEARLAQLVQLANHSLFDINDALQRIPGATDVRRGIVKETLGYLDTVSRDATGDPRLLRTIAAGYMRLGDVLGLPTYPNLGDTEGALANYRKAEKMVNRLRVGGGDAELGALWLQLQQRMGLTLTRVQRSGEAIAIFEKAIAQGEILHARYPSDVELQRVQGMLHQVAAEAYGIFDTGRAMWHVRREIAIQTRLVAEWPANDELMLDLSSSYGRLASLQHSLHQGSEAVENARRSVDIREEINRRHPDDVMILRDLMVGYGRLGDFLGGPIFDETLHDSMGALAIYGKALRIAERLAAADPANHTARIDVAKASLRVGSVCLPAGQCSDAIAHLRTAVDTFESLLRENPKIGGVMRELALAWEQLGRRLEEMGDRDAALAALRRSLALATDSVRADPRDGSARAHVMHTYEALLPLLAESGERQDALSSARAAIVAAKDHVASGSRLEVASVFMAKAYEWQGQVYEKLAESPVVSTPDRRQDRADARQAYARSLTEWQDVARKFPLAPESPGRIAWITQRLAHWDR